MVKREGTITNLESVKRYLEKRLTSTVDDEFPPKFLEPFILRGLRLDLIQPGRVVFSMNIPPRLLVRILPTLFPLYIVLFFFLLKLINLQNSGKYLHVGAIVTLVDVVGAIAIPTAGFPLDTGVSLEINVSCLDAAYANVSLFHSLIPLPLSLIIQFSN